VEAFLIMSNATESTANPKDIVASTEALEAWHRILLSVRRLEKPVIASVNGVAVGAGLDLALVCDIRIASEGVKFGEAYVCVGGAPDSGANRAAESHLQRQMRIDVRRDACFEEAMRYAHNRINPKIIRAFLNKSGDTIRWLEDMGLKIYGLSPYYPGQTMVT
jgi:enoyl-CoA hydratase/carnithine racemase